MTQEAQVPAEAGASKQPEARPSLYGVRAGRREKERLEGERVSILGGLSEGGHARGARRSLSRGVWLFVALVVVGLAGLATFGLEGRGREALPAVTSSGPSSSIRASASASPLPMTPDPLPGQAATIENDVRVAAPDIDRRGPQVAMAEALPAETAVDEDRAKSGESIEAKTGSPRLASAGSDREPAKSIKVEAEQPRRLITSTKRISTTPGAPKRFGSTSKTPDSDVDLIEALVRHVDRKSIAEQGRVAMESSNSRPPISAAATAAVATQHDPKRDIVEVSPNSTTADLVRRCKALGFLEGELCRWRICGNLWGTDPACPSGSGSTGD